MKHTFLMRRMIAIASAAALLVTSSAVATITSENVSAESAIATLASTSSVTIQTASGAEESAYATWSAVTDATGYNVYYKKSGGSYTQVDSMLIRQYSDCFRVDVPGLAAGSYTLKIVPVIGGSEDTSKQAETSSLMVESYDRTGFAFSDTDGSCGAYNADGTLKSDAIVLYLTEETKDTMTLEIATNADGSKTSVYTGIQYILDAIKSQYETRPVCIRVIGTVTDPEYTASGDMLIDGNKSNTSGKAVTGGVTLEGIGEDAALNGWGIRLKNISSCEVRNLGTMLVDSDEGDNLGLQQDNDHVWIHNCDFFYGLPGSDSDQKKGDGALDCKKSTYVTFSYNHFWDNGKCNLLGLSEGTTEGLYITYHHNWYDHSDSRHPRVRYYSAHVYNNYYDGNAKYGIGACLGCSVFAENNYFNDCKYPMMISMQGSDILEGTDNATFSKEDGGMIKAYGNYMVGQKSFISYQEDNTEFDAYVASSRSETVPSTVTSSKGGNTYNNFDTSSVMYSYTADAAEDVPAIVTAKAGRLNGGDIQFTFTEADASSSDVNEELMSLLKSYTSPVVAIGSGFSDSTSGSTSSGSTSSGSSGSDSSGSSSGDTGSTGSAGSGSSGSSSSTTPGNETHNFTENGLDSTFYTIVGNLSTSKGTVTYNGLTLTQCLKLETDTSISFSTTASGSITLVFVENEATIRVDNVKYTADGDGIITVSLAAGDHTITKANTANLFYMVYADNDSSSGSSGGTSSGSSDGSASTVGTQIHNFTENGLDSDFYTIVGNLSTSKGTVTYNGLTLTQCLKLETDTYISFSTTASGSITLVFVEEAATIYVDDVKYTASGDGIITVSLAAGDHTITKANTANLFYMVYADNGSSSGSSGGTSSGSSDGSASTVGTQIHNFTENGLDSDFYTIVGNLSTSKGTVTYNGLTLTQCLKLETDTYISFHTTTSGSITLVFVEEAATIYVDDVKYTASGDGIITVSLAAGDHTITKANTANLFYMVYSDSDDTTGDTSTTSPSDNTTKDTTETVPAIETTESEPVEISEQTSTQAADLLIGDVTGDGEINLADAVFLAKMCNGIVTYNETQAQCGDCDGVPGLSANDILTLLKFNENLISSLPL